MTAHLIRGLDVLSEHSRTAICRTSAAQTVRWQSVTAGQSGIRGRAKACSKRENGPFVDSATPSMANGTKLACGAAGYLHVGDCNHASGLILSTTPANGRDCQVSLAEVVATWVSTVRCRFRVTDPGDCLRIRQGSRPPPRARSGSRCL